MVKNPFKKWDRVDTFCALLVDLGLYYLCTRVGGPYPSYYTHVFADFLCHLKDK